MPVTPPVTAPAPASTNASTVDGPSHRVLALILAVAGTALLLVLIAIVVWRLFLRHNASDKQTGSSEAKTRADSLEDFKRSISRPLETRWQVFAQTASRFVYPEPAQSEAVMELPLPVTAAQSPRLDVRIAPLPTIMEEPEDEDDSAQELPIELKPEPSTKQLVTMTWPTFSDDDRASIISFASDFKRMSTSESVVLEEANDGQPSTNAEAEPAGEIAVIEASTNVPVSTTTNEQPQRAGDDADEVDDDDDSIAAADSHPDLFYLDKYVSNDPSPKQMSAQIPASSPREAPIADELELGLATFDDAAADILATLDAMSSSKACLAICDSRSSSPVLQSKIVASSDIPAPPAPTDTTYAEHCTTRPLTIVKRNSAELAAKVTGTIAGAHINLTTDTQIFEECNNLEDVSNVLRSFGSDYTCVPIPALGRIALTNVSLRIAALDSDVEEQQSLTVVCDNDEEASASVDSDKGKGRAAPKAAGPPESISHLRAGNVGRTPNKPPRPILKTKESPSPPSASKANRYGFAPGPLASSMVLQGIEAGGRTTRGRSGTILASPGIKRVAKVRGRCLSYMPATDTRCRSECHAPVTALRPSSRLRLGVKQHRRQTFQ